MTQTSVRTGNIKANVILEHTHYLIYLIMYILCIFIYRNSYIIYRDTEVWFCDSGDVIIVKPGKRLLSKNRWMQTMTAGGTNKCEDREYKSEHLEHMHYHTHTYNII